MIKFILAHDGQDAKLGHFFTMCNADIKNILVKEKHQLLLEIESHRLTEVYLEVTLSPYLNDKFIFFAYSHGTENELFSSEKYLNLNSNLQLFQNSLFYTFSCLTGVNLGQKLVNNGCLAFIGYKIEACIVGNNEDIFVESANYGIKCFLSGAGIGNSFKQMKEKHTELIDATYKKYPLVASTLRSNRDGLILIGNKNLIISDLN